MRKTIFARASRIPTRKYRIMRAPDGHDIDITADLTGGADDAALGDRPVYAQSADSHMATPPGTQPVHGDAQNPNKQPAAQEPPKAAPSLREELSAAFKGTEDKPTTQAAGTTADQQVAAPVAYSGPALTQDGDGKWRTPDGLFASSEQVAAFQTAQTAPVAQEPPSPLLQSLTPVEQTQFQSLPAELRQLVERTMEGLNTRAAKYGEYDMLEQQLIGPRRTAWAQQGMTPAVAVNQLFALSDFASTNPGEFVMWFAQQNRLDLDALLDARDAAAANVDPALQQLQGTVQQLQGTVQQFQQSAEQQRQETAVGEVNSYAMEKDATGVLKHPYLPTVMEDWMVQISAVRAANPTMPNLEVLDRAYQNACWGKPEVRAKMQEASDKVRRDQEAQRVQAAKSAGSSITGGPAGDQSTVPNNANLSLRDELESQFAAARA